MKNKRKSGEGLLRKRKDGRWEGRVVIGYDEKGLPITKNVTAKTKSACAEKLKNLKKEVEPKKSTIDLTAKTAFGVWIDFWYKNYVSFNLKKTTLSGYRNVIYNHIIPTLGEFPLEDLTPEIFQKFITEKKANGRLQYENKLGKGLSDRMIRLIFIVSKMSLNKAIEVGLLYKNPLEELKAPPKSTKEMQVLSQEELYRFLLQAKYDDYFEIILLALTTGMRRGEILGLKWEDINFETGELHICRQVTCADGKVMVSIPKTKTSERTIILPESVLGVLSNYKTTINSEWLFPSPLNNDLPREPTSVYKKTQRILERAGCKKVRFHDLRHTFATNALASGVDIKTLSLMIGHVSAETTINVYLHSTIEMKKIAADKIDNKIGKNKPNLDNSEAGNDITPKEEQNADFQPKNGKHRKSGTGCISKISDNLYEGRYSPKFPNGKRVARNVYAHTQEECEKLLAKLIVDMKAEIQQEREKLELEKQQEECAIYEPQM